jgi:hypothetical protein
MFCVNRPWNDTPTGTPSFFRWGFNGDSQKCETFNFGGCKGNLNSFLTAEECVNRNPFDEASFRPKAFEKNCDKNCYAKIFTQKCFIQKYSSDNYEYHCHKITLKSH